MHRYLLLTIGSGRLSAVSARIFLLALAALLAAGCGGGYETVTTRGERVKEWFLPLDGGRIEAYAVWPDEPFSIWAKTRKPRLALLLLHAAQGRAQRFRRAMFSLAQQGLFTMSISLPGFGESTGPEDFAGPRSVAAALKAVDYLAGKGDISEGHIAVFGSGQGATTALLAAAQSQRVALVAVEGGVYDLGGAYDQLPPRDREQLRSLLGGTPAERPAAYAERSPLRLASKLKQPVLILHSKDNRRFPLSEAEKLAGALRGEGLPVRFVLTKGRARELNPRYPSLRKWVVPFMREHMGKITGG